MILLHTVRKIGIYSLLYEVVYVTFRNPAFCFFLNLTGVRFRGNLQHVGDVSEQKIKC